MTPILSKTAVVCYTVVLSVVMQRSTKNGCVAD